MAKEFERFQVRYSTDVLVVSKGEGIAGNALMSHQPVTLSEIPEQQYGVHHNLIKQLGLKSGIAIPLNKGGHTLAVVVFFGLDEQSPRQQVIDEFNSYANGLVMSGFMQQVPRSSPNTLTFPGSSIFGFHRNFLR
jgi:hypothetical protein